MCSHPGSLRPLASGQQAYKPSLSLTPTFPQREHLSTADQSRVPRQAQAQTSTPRSFPDIIHSSQSRTIQSRNADYDASDTPLRRQADCLTIHNLPNPIESAYSPHRQSASISPQELSNGSSRATTSGWEADVDPSKMFDYALTHRESENLSTGVTSATSPKGSWVSRPSEAKGKAINQRDGRFGEESAGEVKKRRVEDSMREVERDLGSVRFRFPTFTRS